MLSQRSNHKSVGLRVVLFWASLLLYGVWLGVPHRALAQITIPELSSPVIDSGDFFSAQQEDDLRKRLVDLKQREVAQMQIWTLASLEGESIEGLSIRAVDKWKLGNRERDDGLLLTIARAERRYRLEVGQGLEGILPDLRASQLLRKFLVPSLRTGTTSAGVLAMIDKIEELIQSEKSVGFNSEKKEQSNALKTLLGPDAYDSFVIFFFLGLLPLPVVLLAIFGGGRGRLESDNSVSLYGNMRRGYRPRRGSWGGGSWSGGGGSWSGGGGGFSGGGASGDW